MKKKINATKVISHVVLFLFTMSCLIPFLLLVSSSLTERDELVKYGIGIIPRMPKLNSYKAVFEYPVRIIRAFGVSILITAAGTVLNLVICFLAAFALSNHKFSFRRPVAFYLYFTMMFGGGLVPYYITCTKYLHLADNILVLILPMLAGPMTIFLLRTYLYDIPYTLHEAAKIDGASEYQVMFHVVLPLARTPLAIIGFQTALSYWNSWYDAMLFITDPKLYPIQTLLQNIMSYANMLKNSRFTDSLLSKAMASMPTTSIISATCVIAVAPMLLTFLLFQKQFIYSITNGAVKE